MISAHRLQWAVVVMLLMATTVSAQGTPSPQTPTVPPGNMWSHGTTLNAFGGAAAASGDRAAVGGGAFGWEIKPWIALEGGAGWLDWGQNAHGFTGTLTTNIALLTPRAFVPFLAGGVGVYHASFDRFDAAMPRFYRHRMMGPGTAPSDTVAFTDPSLVAGGGFEVFMSRHWTIRPEVMANVVMADSRRFVATTGVVRVGYHFEDHVAAGSRR